jgi:anti-sigma regulatory factor (Ser/Thr protein kinase)
LPPASWLALRARPDYAGKARRFAASCVESTPHDAYSVALITSEVVTNAIEATAALRAWPDDVYPLAFELAVTDRYVHLAVTDPDHRPLPASDVGGLEAEHGRGLSIVDQIAVTRWVTYAERHKTVHVLLAAPEVVLTAEELRQIGAPA